MDLLTAVNNMLACLYKNGRLENHGHRDSDTRGGSCDVCKVINDLEDAIENEKRKIINDA
jgi:hypothetical protein